MVEVDNQSEGKGALDPESPKPKKTLRKLFSKKLGFANAKADRADQVTTRESEVEQKREPPADEIDGDFSTVAEKEISALHDKGNEFFGKGEYDAALRMYSEALKLLKNASITSESGEENAKERGEVHMSNGVKRFRTARLLVNIGAVHIRRDNYDDAISVLAFPGRSAAGSCARSNRDQCKL